MSKLKTIQEKIEYKAQKRAEQEVHKALMGLRLLVKTDVFNKTYIKIDEKSVSLKQAFWWKDKPIPQAIIEELKEKYIPEEVDKFVDNVERLKQDVDQLYNYPHYE